MKRAIAMKCNQEQWDIIKGKLVGFLLAVSPGFRNYPYLVNNSLGNFDIINNFSSVSKRDHNREVHEIWNEQVFLEACGIETEKIFKGSELQLWTGYKWATCNSANKYRLKPDHSAEIAELERQIEILKNK